MSLYYNKERGYEDPDQLMIGQCQVCKHETTIARRQAKRPSGTLPTGKEPGSWDDLYFTECRVCLERSRQAHKNEGLCGGTKVFLRVKEL